MSGILDNKSRVIDAILTYEGRRQMADGKFVVKYATFSDSAVYYEKDLIESHTDPTGKIYLECFNLPQDQITFESDDSGRLVPFRQHNSIGAETVTGAVTSSLSWTTFFQGQLKTNTKVYALSSTVTGSYTESPLKGNEFASQIEGILTSSFDNFQKLNIIGTFDSLFDDQDFALNTNEIYFPINPDQKTLQMQEPTSVNTIDALFSDEKLRNVDNFLYLPPIKKSNSSVDKTNIEVLKNSGLLLGNYPPWGPTQRLNYSDINKELKAYEATSKTVYFDPTSKDNTIVAQFFEVGHDSVSKLDIIEYGKLSNHSFNTNTDVHHVFFVGKVVVDDNGSDNFVHLFTLVFEANENGQ